MRSAVSENNSDSTKIQIFSDILLPVFNFPRRRRRLYHFVIALSRAKKAESVDVRSWERIADKLSKAGWTWGCVATVDAHGRTIFVADAHRGDGKRYVVHADDKFTAFLELERAVCVCLLSEQNKS